MQLLVVEKNPEGNYQVVQVIKSVVEQEGLFCASHVML
jgi:hypothetical protein